MVQVESRGNPEVGLGEGRGVVSGEGRRGSPGICIFQTHLLLLAEKDGERKYVDWIVGERGGGGVWMERWQPGKLHQMEA